MRRQKGDLAGAIADLEVAARLKPDDPQFANNLGVAYRFAKRDDDAIKAFQKAVALAPNDAGFHFNLAVVYRRQTEKNPDMIPQAITEYEKATGLDPGNAEGWFDLAAAQNPKPKTVAIVATDAEFQHKAAESARRHAKARGIDIG